MMTLYRLDRNNRLVVLVEMEAADFMPVRPRVNRVWLRRIVMAALRPRLTVQASS